MPTDIIRRALFLGAGAGIAVGAGLAAVLAPSVRNGWRPLYFGRATVPVAVFVNRMVTGGAVLGVATGAIAGLVIGLRAYPPTAAAATVEGAVLGAAGGIVLTVILAAVIVCFRVRPLPG